MQICKHCGLPLELCTCKIVEREAAKIRVYAEKRRWGKTVTIVEGLPGEQKQVASKLKSWLACGGTIKEGKIELQGDHRAKLKELLTRLGYQSQQIEVL